MKTLAAASGITIGLCILILMALLSRPISSMRIEVFNETPMCYHPLSRLDSSMKLQKVSMDFYGCCMIRYKLTGTGDTAIRNVRACYSEVNKWWVFEWLD